MNRRAFLETLLGSAAALTLDPERLLWLPGEKTVFIPPSIRLIPINIAQTQLGEFHNGLSSPSDWITYQSFGAMDTHCQLAYLRHVERVQNLFGVELERVS